MRKTLKIALREYKATVRTKGFIIGLFLAPLLMSGSFLAITLLKDQIDVTDKRVVILDHSGIVADYLINLAAERNREVVVDTTTGKKVKPSYILEKATPDPENLEQQRLVLSDRIRAKEIYAFLEIGPDVAHPGENRESSRIKFHGENTAMDDLRSWLRQPINDRLRLFRLEEAGITENEVPDLFYWISVEGMGLTSVDDSGTVKDAERTGELEALGAPLIMLMLMFLMTMMGAVPLLNSVMEEKAQRIAEVILGSVRPFQFMLGKVIGGLAVALTGALVYVVLGLYAVSSYGIEDKIPLNVLPWFFAFLVLHITMTGSIMAAIGSACNDAKDAQNLSFPAMLPNMIPMFILFPVLKEPLSAFSTWMSLIPPFTPMLMILRLSTPMAIPAWQPWVGMAIVLVSAVFSVWAGGRIFRVGILLQGTPPKLANLLRWIARG
ncbi:MAG: ABC transporter permease [Candidatus Neomarinimicrobiota bacterium]